MKFFIHSSLVSFVVLNMFGLLSSEDVMSLSTSLLNLILLLTGVLDRIICSLINGNFKRCVSTFNQIIAGF